MKKVIAIFDIGKTNKKLLLFDEHYKVVMEENARISEITDEDGFPAEDLEGLQHFIFDSLRKIFDEGIYHIDAINFSAYGASFVYLDEKGHAAAPLYNYLKPYPANLLRQFYDDNGGETIFSLRTASPVLGSLNSGMQFYRIKKEKPELFQKIKYAVHLPQYLSYLLSGHIYSDLTSIGCHTNLWDFQNNDYHDWVKKEGLAKKMAPIVSSSHVSTSNFSGHPFSIGVGLHDSSAALIPYLVNFKEPFLLISTGTWCITLNPFSQKTLTAEELKSDCLCYLQYNGTPVKAARLFAGFEHEEQVKRIALHFNSDTGYYKQISFDPEIVSTLQQHDAVHPVSLKESVFSTRELALFPSGAVAYHQLMIDLVQQQVLSSGLVMEGEKIKRIFVDGGFSRNEIYMNLLAAVFPDMEVFTTSMAQASALGAALAIHDAWNTRTVPSDIIELKYYAAVQDSAG